MSFSMDVKDEIATQISSARHCRLAELAAMISNAGHFIGSYPNVVLRFQTENLVVARKYFTLIRKTFNIKVEISVKINSNQKKIRIYSLVIKNSNDVMKVMQAVKLPMDKEMGIADGLVVQNACCKRAFIRGAFLTSGSMSNPKKAYHLEMVVSDAEKAQQLKNMIQAFSIDAKTIQRKKNFVVYIKEGSQIVDLLNIMEAHVALMNLENVRILKEMRNSINRQVNCEAANISKTVAASTKQIEDIIYIRDTVGFGDLAEGLEEIARLRIQHPEASLKELGSMLLPPIGKSGVNHRLRKLSMIADHIREHKEEKSYDNEGYSN